MKYDLSKHPYFEAYTDPETGVTSYLLKERAGEQQMNFYFTNSGMTQDGEYLWFQALNWPAEISTLAAVSMNPEKPGLRHFPAAGFSGGGNLPVVMPGSHDVLFGVRESIYKVSPDGKITKVLSLDPDFLNNRIPTRLMTHGSISCDARRIILDIRMADKTYIATGDLETGEVTMVHKFARHYDHAMYAPHDPNLILIDQDWERDSQTGERFDVDARMWLMDLRGTRFEPVLPGNWFRHNGSIICHDFWSKDGWICWPDLLDRVYEHNPATRETNPVWNRAACHAHTIDRRYWVCDDSPYKWGKRPCKVVFFDRESGKELDIFSALPVPNCPKSAVFHLEPHPSFTDDGEYIVSMTTVRDGRVDLAVTPVEPLISMCRERGIYAGPDAQPGKD